MANPGNLTYDNMTRTRLARTHLTRTHWPAVWAAVAAGIIAAAYVGKLPPSIPLLRDEFHLSLVAAGWVNSIFNTLSVCTAALIGVLAGRYGALRFCGAGLATMILGGALGATAHSEGALFASRILEGGGFIAITVSAPTLIIAACTPRQRNLTLGLWASYLPFGSGLTILASPFLLGAIGWRGLWLVIVLLTLVCAIALWRCRRFYRAPTAAVPTLSTIVRALRQPGPWWLAMGFACYSLMYYAVAVWLPTFLMQERGASITEAALLTALLIGINAVGNLAGGWLMHRAAPRGHLISLAFLVMAACSCGIFSAALPDTLRFSLSALFMLVGGMIPASILTGSPVYARDASQISSIQGLIVQLAQIGPFTGPPLVAAVVSATGNWEAALRVLLAAAALGTLFGQLADRTERALARPATP
ncbi:MAG: MFS transporter [Rhodocyclaceae bacterium]|nr:MAG: MFS transporter [Rhodocyclaceae bacterium]